MKYKLNIVKQIVTPIEVEAEDIMEAAYKAHALIPETDTDHGKVEYIIDTKPSASMIRWYEDKKDNKNEQKIWKY